MRPHTKNLSATLAALIVLTAAAAGPARGVEASAAGGSSPLPAPLVEQVKRAVVVVESYDDRGRLVAQGSGFFTGRGEVTTSLHVVGRATRVSVRTYAGETLSAHGLSALDARRDLALLSVAGPPADAEPLPLADAPPRAGAEVFVVSNPRGSLWEVSRGTALGLRELEGLGLFVNITAPIYGGSSGGPVVDLRGRVVGVAALGLRSTREQYFAVPCDESARLRPRALMPFPLQPAD